MGQTKSVPQSDYDAERRRRVELEEAERRRQQTETQNIDHWREDRLGQWDEKDEDNLMTKINGCLKITQAPGGELEFFRIIFVGPVGAGKSSLINAFNSALKGRIDNRAVEGGRDHTTKAFLEYAAFNKDQQRMRFTFCDVRGLGRATAGSTKDDLLKAILGQKNVGDQFVPGYQGIIERPETFSKRAAYMIVFVIDAADYISRVAGGHADESLSQLLALKDETDGWAVGRALLITHMDVIDKALKDNIQQVHHSGKVRKVVERIVEATNFPWRSVFPVVCPVWHVHEMPISFSVHLLYTLLTIVRDTVDMYQQRLDTENRQQQEMSGNY